MPKRLKRNPEVKLPSEVLQKIFLHLNFIDILNCEQVCWHWKNIADDEVIWERLLCSDYTPGKSPLTKMRDTWKQTYQNFYRFEHGKPVKLLDTVSKHVTSVTFSNSGRYLVCATSEEIIAWDVEDDFSLLRRAPLGRTRQNMVSTNPRGAFCFNESDDMLLVAASSHKHHDELFDRKDMAIIYSFPELEKKRRFAFESRFPTDTENGSPIKIKSFTFLGWFGLDSFLVEISLGAGNQDRCCYIYSGDEATTPKFVFQGYKSAFLVDNTKTGCKHVIVQAVKSAHSYCQCPNLELISLEVRGMGECDHRGQPTHHCHRCAKDSSGRCLVEDYTAQNVSSFEIRYSASLKEEFYSCDILTAVYKNRVYIHFQYADDYVPPNNETRPYSCLPSVKVYTADFERVVEVQFQLPLLVHINEQRDVRRDGQFQGETRDLQPFWKWCNAGVDTMLLEFFTDAGVRNSMFVYEISRSFSPEAFSVFGSLNHSIILLRKARSFESIKIQPGSGQWVVAADSWRSGMLSCWKM